MSRLTIYVIRRGSGQPLLEKAEQSSNVLTSVSFIVGLTLTKYY